MPDKESLQLEARVLTQKITSLDRAIGLEKTQPTPDIQRLESLDTELASLKKQRFKIRQSFNSLVEDEKAKALQALDEKLRISRSWITRHQELTSLLTETAHDLDAEISQSSGESEQSDFQRKLMMFRRALYASLEAMSRVRF